MHTFDRMLADAWRAHLDRGEELLWAGKPRQGLRFSTMDFFLIPFSLLWGGFALFWEYKAIESGVIFMQIWGIPFVLIGLYMIVGRFFFDAAKRKTTLYGISPNRIVIKSGIVNKRIQSIDIKSLTNLSLDEKADGSGTILLGAEAGFGGMFRQTGWPGTPSKAVPALEGIPDARRVYRQISELQRGAKSV